MLELSESSVVVTGVEPGQWVVVLGVGQELRGFLPVDVHVVRSGEADAGGAVTVDLEAVASVLQSRGDLTGSNNPGLRIEPSP